MAVELRRAVPEDAAGIAAVRGRAWRAAYRELSVEQRETFWRQALAEDAGPAVYARFGFEPDGSETTHERSGLNQVRLRRAITPTTRGSAP